MGLFSRLLDTDDNARHERSASRRVPLWHVVSTDSQAVARYRYMIKTAPPETIEQAHTEAFGRLTSEQRRQLLRVLARVTPTEERAAVLTTSIENVPALARVATRAEIRDPGVMERKLSQPGMGFGAGLLSSFAAGFVGGLVAQSFFSALGAEGGASDAEADVTAGDDVPPSDVGQGRAIDPGRGHDLVDDDGSFDLSDFEI
jgi:hypothetical protein